MKSDQAMDTAVNFEGYLEKTVSGIFKNVSRVWMVLNNLTLEYYKDKLKSDCIGSIDVHNIQIVRLTGEKEGTEFQIITEDKSFKFIAESEELATAWVKVIQATMSKKTHNKQNSQQSLVRHEIIQVIPKPTNIFGVTLKPTHASRASEHDEEASASQQKQSQQHKLNDSKSKQMPTDIFDLKGDNLTGSQKSAYAMSKYTASTGQSQISSDMISNKSHNLGSSQKMFVEQEILDERFSKLSYSKCILNSSYTGASVISLTSQSTKLETFESIEISQSKNSKSNKQSPSFKPPLPLTAAVKITTGQSCEEKTVIGNFTNPPPSAGSEKLKYQQTEIAGERSAIFPDLSSIKEEQIPLSVNDHTITANAITSPFNNHETTLTDCKLDESRHDLKGDEIPNNVSEMPNINSTPNDTGVHRKDETNVYKNAEHSTINNCTYEDVDISKVQMRNSKRFSATESQRCKVNDLPIIDNNNTGGVKFRKLSKNLSTADAPVDVLNRRCIAKIAHHTNYEPGEIFNSEEDNIFPAISPSTHICLSQTSTIDNAIDSIYFIPTTETNANDFTNASSNTTSFTSFHRLQQYFKAMLPEEFDIEYHRVCSKNPVENLQSLLDHTYCT